MGRADFLYSGFVSHLKHDATPCQDSLLRRMADFVSSDDDDILIVNGYAGTGKTTVARLLGQIYKEMGLLSSGHVVLEERKNLIGRYYDSEGQAVDNALNRAKGGILLMIDKAKHVVVSYEDEINSTIHTQEQEKIISNDI